MRKHKMIEMICIIYIKKIVLISDMSKGCYSFSDLASFVLQYSVRNTAFSIFNQL